MNEANKSKVVAIYCRVSTTEQVEEGYSIGEQERLLIEYCNKNHFEVFKTYADRGISGKDIKHRPAIQQLLQDASEKKFNMVISWKINRLSRKLSDAIKIVETLERYGITYRSYSEPFESDTPAGRMQFQMMALIGEFERSTIAQNVKMGMCAKARAGEWCGGVAPLGYNWVRMEGTENSSRKKSRLVIDEKEAETVRLLYELYASGKGYKAIVNKINKEGYKTKHGNEFSVAQECLNMKDINQSPTNFKGSFQEWIQELTTFIFLYPKEWKEIYEEYKLIAKTKNKTELAFFRDEEGYLRKKGESDVFLKVHLEETNRERINHLKESLNWAKLFSFEDYMRYCALDRQKRKDYIHVLKGNIEKKIISSIQGRKEDIQFNLSFESDMDNSDFTGRDIYIDALNDTYIIL